jgi:hypothetical protein
MARPKFLIVTAVVLLMAGVAAANNMFAGPSVGLTVSGGSLTAQTAPASAAPSTVGPSTGSPTVAGTSTTPSASPVTGAETTIGGTPTVEQIISLTRSVSPGTPVTAFTVPAGRQLVLTDVFVTNPGTSPTCGAAISPSGTTPTVAPTTTAATATTTGASESGTGVLCVPAQTSLNLGLTTGLEFAAGQSVVLANATTTDAPSTTPLHYHLRGFLVTPGL